MNRKNVVLFGAGRHTRSLINLVKLSNYNILGIYDNSFDPNINENINGIEVVDSIINFNKFCQIILSIGDNKIRKNLYKENFGLIIKENLIHETAIIENHVSLGESNQIFSRVVVNSKVELGVNNIINTGCILEHEVKIGNNNHISVGNGCFVGADSVIIDKIKICDNVIIGANSVIVKDMALLYD